MIKTLYEGNFFPGFFLPAGLEERLKHKFGEVERLPYSPAPRTADYFLINHNVVLNIGRVVDRGFREEPGKSVYILCTGPQESVEKVEEILGFK